MNPSVIIVEYGIVMNCELLTRSLNLDSISVILIYDITGNIVISREIDAKTI